MFNRHTRCRSRLTYEQFSEFLSNVKELNAYRREKEVSSRIFFVNLVIQINRKNDVIIKKKTDVARSWLSVVLINVHCICDECQGKIKVELSRMCTSSCCLDLKTDSTVWVKKLASLLTWCWVGLQLKAAQFATNSMFHPKIYTCNTHVPPNCGDWVFSSSKVASWPWCPVQLHFHNFISLP
jgi:hypothetical protein